MNKGKISINIYNLFLEAVFDGLKNQSTFLFSYRNYEIQKLLKMKEAFHYGQFWKKPQW